MRLKKTWTRITDILHISAMMVLISLVIYQYFRIQVLTWDVMDLQRYIMDRESQFEGGLDETFILAGRGLK